MHHYNSRTLGALRLVGDRKPLPVPGLSRDRGGRWGREEEAVIGSSSKNIYGVSPPILPNFSLQNLTKVLIGGKTTVVRAV